METDFSRLRGLLPGCVERSFDLLELIWSVHFGIADVERQVVHGLADLRGSLLATKAVIDQIGDTIATPGTPPFDGVAGRSYCEVAYRYAHEVYFDVLESVDAPKAYEIEGDVTAPVDFSAIVPKAIADIRATLTRRLPSETGIESLLASADAEICRETTVGDVAQREAAGNAVAAQLLFGWTEILDAIKRTNDDEDRVKQLNIRFDGPITTRQGGGPLVKKADLIAWWNGLQDQIEESQKRRTDAEATVADSYQYGIAGAAVIPAIAGHEKTRKTTKKR